MLIAVIDSLKKSSDVIFLNVGSYAVTMSNTSDYMKWATVLTTLVWTCWRVYTSYKDRNLTISTAAALVAKAAVDAAALAADASAVAKAAVDAAKAVQQQQQHTKI